MTIRRVNGLPPHPPFGGADEIIFDEDAGRLYHRLPDGTYATVGPVPPAPPPGFKVLRGYFFVGTGAGGAVEVTNLSIQRNTLGAAPVVSRSGIGQYRIDLGVGLPAVIAAYGGWCSDGGSLFIEPGWAGATYLTLSVREPGSAAQREVKPSAINFWVLV